MNEMSAVVTRDSFAGARVLHGVQYFGTDGYNHICVVW
jgi:hypothetical protein